MREKEEDGGREKDAEREEKGDGERGGEEGGRRGKKMVEGERKRGRVGGQIERGGGIFHST